MNINYDEVNKIYNKFPEEVSMLKSLLEHMTSIDKSYNPMITFIDSSQERSVAITSPNIGNFTDTVLAFSEMLQLYTPTASHAAVVSFTANLVSEDSTPRQVLNIFLISDDYGYVLTLPFSKDSSNKIQWLEDLAVLSEIEDCEYDQDGKDMIVMFYMFTHMPSSAFSISDVLSYLTYKGYAVKTIKNNYSFFEILQS